jgi:WhiB family redox-sensing transcriptional regulator
VVTAATNFYEDVIPPMSLSWREHAACRGVSTDVFYPVSDEDADIAKAICDQCPVREACLEFAITEREREGVWGGTTERERRRIVRQRRKSA